MFVKKIFPEVEKKKTKAEAQILSRSFPGKWSKEVIIVNTANTSFWIRYCSLHIVTHLIF